MKKIVLFFVLSVLSVYAQQPQTGSPDPQALQGINAKWANGVGPGYWVYQKTGTCTGLNVCISPGTVPQCVGTSHVEYAGTSSFALTNNATNYIYIDLDNSCVPAVNTSGYSNRNPAIARVVTSAGVITSLKDDRSWFSSQVVQGGVNAQTGTSYTIANTDRGKLVTASNSGAQAYTLPTTLGITFIFAFQNEGTGTVTFTPSSGTINGAASLALASGSGAWFYFDGTNWEAVVGNIGGTGNVTGSSLTNHQIVSGAGGSAIQVENNPQLAAATTPACITQGYSNDTSTGTTNGLIAKLNGNHQVVKVGTSDTEAVGIVVSGGATSGTAQVCGYGTAACTFDNTSTAGHYVQISTGTAGDCHDAGSTLPTSGGTIIGRVADGGTAGSHNVSIALTPPGSAASGGGITPTVLVANEGTTGTSTNHLAKFNASGLALTMGTGDVGPTTNYIGVCISGCGTSGIATIQYLGRVQLQFDGNTTAGNQAQVSNSTAGDGQDAGGSSIVNCSTNRSIGTIVDTGTGAGLRNVDLTQVQNCKATFNTGSADNYYVPIVNTGGANAFNLMPQFLQSNIGVDGTGTNANLEVNSASGHGGLRLDATLSNDWTLIRVCGTGSTCGHSNWDTLYDSQTNGRNGDDMHRFVGGTYSVVKDYGTVGSTQTIDPDLSDTITFTMSANLTISLTGNGDNAGHKLTILACQNGTGGFSLTMPGNFKHVGAWTTTLSDCTAQSFVYDGTNYWHIQ